MEKKNRKKTAIEAMILISVLAVAMIGLWFVAQHIEEDYEVEKPEKPIKASLRILGEDWQIEYLEVQTLNNTVYKLLLECSERYDFPVGSTHWEAFDSEFVNSINGTENGEGGNWWQYYVNDVYGEIGCDRKEIFEGDMIEWRFEEPGQ